MAVVLLPGPGGPPSLAPVPALGLGQQSSRQHLGLAWLVGRDARIGCSSLRVESGTAAKSSCHSHSSVFSLAFSLLSVLRHSLCSQLLPLLSESIPAAAAFVPHPTAAMVFVAISSAAVETGTVPRDCFSGPSGQTTRSVEPRSKGSIHRNSISLKSQYWGSRTALRANDGSFCRSPVVRAGSRQSGDILRWRCEASTGSTKPEIAQKEGQEQAAEPASNGSAYSAPAKPKLIAYDYGFQSKFLRTGPNVPSNVFKLALENFAREYAALRTNVLYEPLSDVRTDNIKRDGRQLVLAYAGRFLVSTLKFFDKVLTLYDGLPEIKPPVAMPEASQELRRRLQQLTLSNEAVAQREKDRPQVEAPGWILLPYQLLCWMLDVIFNNRPIQRFWFLETVARMPYFSYISMLHLYETLGWWRVGAEVRKVHFAEEWNEMNHLRIMESLGGDRLWVDRFFAQHAAVLYYWVLNAMFLISPRVAYNFSELIEAHAVDTYGEFVDANAELLKTLPPSPAAMAYYCNDDLYMFDEFQTSRVPESRRPKIESLYDVFCAIRDDEMEHVKTMSACQQLDSVVRSPNRPGYAPLPSPADVYFEGLVAKPSSSASASPAGSASPSAAASAAFSAAVGESNLPKDVLPQALQSKGDSLK